MRRTSMVVGWIVVVAALCPVVPQAADDGREGWWTRPKTLEALDLTPSQQAQIAEIEQGKRERIQESRRAVAGAMRQMLSTLDDASASPELIQEKRAQLEEAWMGHLHVTVDYWQKLRPVLTDEQWKALPSAAPQAVRLGMVQVRTRQRAEVTD